MAIRGGGFQRKNKTASSIPTSSLADIAFLLLIFFMVTTTFQNDRNVPINWAQAVATEKIDEKAKNILNIWVEQNGNIFINDRPVPMAEVSGVVGPLYAASGRALVISIRGDRDARYSTMDVLQKELVEAGVVRVVFATELEKQMQGVRR